jgi:HEAT repeat protein
VLLADRALERDLESLLESSSGTARRGAAVALAFLGVDTGLPELIVAMSANDPRSILTAAMALLALGTPEALDQLLRPTGSWYDALLNAVGVTFDRPLSPEALPRILDLLQTVAPARSTFAAHMLGRSRSREAVAALIELTESDDEHTQHAAAVALGKIGDPSATGVVVRMLDHQHHTVRIDAIRALLALDAKSAMPPLIRTAHSDSNVEVRLEAAAALFKLGHAEGATLLVSLMEREPHPELFPLLVDADVSAARRILLGYEPQLGWEGRTSRLSRLSALWRLSNELG